MRWRNCKRALESPKTFFVLPLVHHSDKSHSSFQLVAEMNRNYGLRLFTKTWPKKTSELNVDIEFDRNEPERPLTATLERPQILDPKLMNQIDMSLIRKEFLAITSLCRTPLASINCAATTEKKSRYRTAIIERRRPLATISQRTKSKKQRKHETLSETEASWEDESLSSGRETRDTTARILRPPRIGIGKGKLRKPAVSVASTEINNNVNNVKDVKTLSTKLLPEPCTTCGRPDAPERFHSHPTTPLKPIQKLEKLEVRIPTKNSVQKPVAIRYKSKLEPKILEQMASIESKVKSSKGPRTLTCYICGREFGTASLPLHEPKCIEKWERENQKLPKQLQKKRPVKPDIPLTKEEWNKFAWESAQAQLVACKNCNRTFFPDRLEVHQRSCKEPQRGPVKSSSTSAIQGLSSKHHTHSVPGLVPCPHCGKLFGSKSVKIHEPQCFKKIQKEKDFKASSTNSIERSSSNDKKSHMFPCYLCGRLFGVSSIYIHEPQCLKKWRAENDKLPAEKRRSTPPKPDMKFTPSGEVDFVGTFNRIWENHLNELIPCGKCKRTFFPNRIEIHRKVCKGNN